jgi:hypothetical protein
MNLKIVLAGVALCFCLYGVLVSDATAQGKGKSNGHGKNKAEKKEKTKGGPPSWAPAHGYRAKTRQVYFPEQNVYYDTQKESYIYFSNGKWEVSVGLPPILKGVDLKIAKKIEMELDTDQPQLYNDEHKKIYGTKK